MDELQVDTNMDRREKIVTGIINFKRDLICKAAGMEFDELNVIAPDRMSLTQLPDGSETYCLDNEPLVTFWPLKFADIETNGTKITTTLPYRMHKEPAR